jgi:hypothetical protein
MKKFTSELAKQLPQGKERALNIERTHATGCDVNLLKNSDRSHAANGRRPQCGADSALRVD